MPKKSDKASPSPRQRKYVKGVLAGKSGAQAAREAGYAEGTAHRATVQIEGKPAVQALFRDLLERAGVTDELLAQRLREGLDAKETKFFQHDGKVTAKRNLVAFSERRATVELICKIKQHVPKDGMPEQPPITVTLVHIGNNYPAANPDLPSAEAVVTVAAYR